MIIMEVMVGMEVMIIMEVMVGMIIMEGGMEIIMIMDMFHSLRVSSLQNVVLVQLTNKGKLSFDLNGPGVFLQPLQGAR